MFAYFTPMALPVPLGATGGWVAVPKWSDVTTATDCGEDRRSTSLDGPWRFWFTDVEYDAVGNVITQSHVAPGAPEDSLKVDLTWEEVDEALWRPLTIQTWSVDPETNALEVVESGSLTHDDLGRLETQTVCVSTDCQTDPLVWAFDRTPRGAVSAVHAPLGRDTTKDWDFGETMVRVETKELDHKTLQDPDDLGRVVVTTDPNGVVRTTDLDGFGRPVRTTVQGAGSDTSYVLDETTWHDDVVPRWSERVHHSHRPGEQGGVEELLSTSYEVYDGFGRVVQTWAAAPRGGWIVAETERDVRGSVRLVSEPHVEAVAFSGSFVRGGERRSWSFVDLLGDEVLRWDVDREPWDPELGGDAPAEGGLTWLDWPKAGQRRTLGWEHQRLEATDTLGRLVEVREGSTVFDNPKPTGTYAWDGRDRVVRFTDGVEASWDYDLDLAGRARQVWRRPNGNADWEPYVGYEWTGPDPYQMWEGSVGTGTLAAEWTYDDLGRTTRKWVRDVVNARGGVTTRWWWDAPPAPLSGPAWKGVRHATQDAAGAILYRYDAEMFGGLGHVSRTTRVWAERPDPPTTMFERTYDLDGRVVFETWPTGRTVASAWTASGHLDQQVVHDPLKDATYTSVVSYDSTYGVASGFDLLAESGPHEVTLVQTVQRNTSMQVSHLHWELDGTTPQLPDPLNVHYGWGEGLLRLKQYTGDEPISYGYDHLRRIATVWDGNVYAQAGLQTLERFEQDEVGNPVETAFADVADHYEYAATTRFNEVRQRKLVDDFGTTTELDDFRYDGMSRLRAWSTRAPGQPQSRVVRRHAYDGAGRLRQVSQGASDNVVYTYDVDDAIAQETRPGNVRIRRFGVAGRSTERPPGTPPWPLDGFHGAEPDADGEIVHFGARHMLTRDGLWMQPEPLLYLGLTNGDLANPRGFGGLYAMGNSNLWADPLGFEPFTKEAATRGAATLDISEDMQTTITAVGEQTAALVKATGNTSAEAASALDWSGPGGTIQPVGGVLNGEAGAPISGPAGNAHGHATGVMGPTTGPQLNNKTTDEHEMGELASSEGVGVSIVNPVGGDVRAIIVAANADGSTTTFHYKQEGKTFVGGALPQPTITIGPFPPSKPPPGVE